MRILITGASGLLGLNLAWEAARHHEVYGTVYRHFLRTKAFHVIQADLTLPGAVERALDEAQPDWVIHCAALASIDKCEVDPALARKLNTELAAEIATHVAKGGARLLHISTDAVFDGQRGDYSEEDTPNPLSIYACTKLEGERAVLDANPQAIIARVNLFGWSASGQRSLSEFFFYNLQSGKRVMGFTDVFFCPLLANDLAQVLLKMLQRGLSGLYHVVSHECLSKYAFGVALAQQFGLDASLIDPTSVRESGLVAVRSPRLTLRTDKLRQALGEPLPHWRHGLEKLFDLYQQGYPQMLKEMSDYGTEDRQSLGR
jgi:dTDP-4-dehydrorhamnose reductase